MIQCRCTSVEHVFLLPASRYLFFWFRCAESMAAPRGQLHSAAAHPVRFAFYAMPSTLCLLQRYATHATRLCDALSMPGQLLAWLRPRARERPHARRLAVEQQPRPLTHRPAIHSALVCGPQPASPSAPLRTVPPPRSPVGRRRGAIPPHSFPPHPMMAGA